MHKITFLYIEGSSKKFRPYCVIATNISVHARKIKECNL